ncbi:MAG TPA: hypothetical protein VLA19_25220 [Herpetosiphonaceae bacterium]|nr:hypothetical protein [Herpetosiphonaceae bacterium]
MVTTAILSSFLYLFLYLLVEQGASNPIFVPSVWPEWLPKEIVAAAPAVVAFLAVTNYMPWPSSGVKLPCRSVKVSKQLLAQTLFAVAFWNLREQELIFLELFEDQGSRPQWKTWVRVRALKRATNGQGIERAILRQLPDSDDDVFHIIHRWFGKDVDNPWNVVVQVVTEEVKALGLEQNCVGISMYEGHADQLAAHWKHFQDNEPALYSALLKNCTQAFTSRRIMTD